MYEFFNEPETLGIISSFPAKGGEVASDNAIERYTHLLVKNFPKNQKVVVFCERRERTRPYRINENVLIIPTYKLNSRLFLVQVLSKILKFRHVKDILVQFEFSIFGGKVIIPQLLSLLLIAKLMGKSIKITFHQVVNDLNSLSGHLAIRKNGFKAIILNGLLQSFYFLSGVLAEKVIVHDSYLRERIGKFIDLNKVIVVPHGMSPEKQFKKGFVQAARNRFGVDRGTKLIGLFGYCSWYKGTDWLIENFARFVKENPKLKIKLLVAGGESPTLRGTMAYRKYHKRLRKVIKEANGDIIYTGFVPERQVKSVFAAVDLFIFPYRTKMSASGAFSLCLGFRKPYMVSREFSKNLTKEECGGRVFYLNYKHFEKSLKKHLSLSGPNTLVDVSGRSWDNVALVYLNESLSQVSIQPKLGYAQAT